MIIKFYNPCDDMWELFDEIDSLSYRKFEIDEPLPDTLQDDCDIIDFTIRRPQLVESKAVIDFMNKNQTAGTRIIAFRPIYLMNNNGRTIETI